MKKLFTFFTLIAICLISFVQTGNAQVNGTAIAPIVSNPTSPVYFYIESASNGTVATGSPAFSADFRGRVIIARAAGVKVRHWTTNQTPLSRDSSLWAIVNVSGVNLLKNKATGLYLTGCHTASTTSIGNGFTFVLNATTTNQYTLKTEDGTGSIAIAWKNNLGDRWSSNPGPNSLASWFFVLPGTDIDLAISNAAAILNDFTAQGMQVGQFTASARLNLQNAIAAATLIQNGAFTVPEKDAAAVELNIAVSTYLAAKKAVSISTAANEYWYFIKSPRGADAESYIENMGVGSQALSNAKGIRNSQLWKIVANGTTGYSIVNRKDGSYMNTAVTPSPIAMGTVSSAPSVAVSINSCGQDNDQKVNNFLIENSSASVASSVANSVRNTFRLHAGPGTTFGTMNNVGSYAAGSSGSAFDNCTFQLIAATAKDFLKISLDSISELKNTCVVGTLNGQYPADAMSIMTQACTDAQTAYDNAATTEGEATTAIATLKSAWSTFKQTIIDNPTGLSSNVDKSIKVFSINKRIVIHGSTNLQAKVFTISGQIIDINKTLNPGIYFVQISNQKFKVCVE